MATEQIPTSIIADDAVTGAKIENNPTVAGNLTVSGTTTTTGALTASGGIANAGTITAGTIGSNVTITDGANPHGWEHIKTIAYSADTATSSTGTSATKMSNVVSSAYTAYKLIIQWGSDTANKDLYSRLLNTSDAVVSASTYFYEYQRTYTNGTEGSQFYGAGDSYAAIGSGVSQGSAGWNGEMILYNCYSAQGNFPQVDGHQLTHNGRESPYHPMAVYRQCGYDQGDHYQMGVGGIQYNANIYVTGFCLYFQNDSSVEKDSFWSCYGLKLPTAD